MMKLSNKHSLLIDQYQEKSKKLVSSFFSNQIWKNKIFLATVIAPTALSILYFIVITSDIHNTESKFVVRSPQKSPPLSMEEVFRKIGFSKFDDDSYNVK